MYKSDTCREEGGDEHHHHGGVVVAGGEGRQHLPPTKRSPRQQHRHRSTGDMEEEVGSSSIGGLGRMRQDHPPDRVPPEGGATMSSEVDGSMASVLHSASSSVGASIHAVSSSYSNEGSRQMSTAKQSPGVITSSSGGE